MRTAEVLRVLQSASADVGHHVVAALEAVDSFDGVDQRAVERHRGARLSQGGRDDYWECRRSEQGTPSLSLVRPTFGETATFSSTVTERPERTAQGYRRFRCRACGKQFNERSDTLLNRAQ